MITIILCNKWQILLQVAVLILNILKAGKKHYREKTFSDIDKIYTIRLLFNFDVNFLSHFNIWGEKWPSAAPPRVEGFQWLPHRSRNGHLNQLLGGDDGTYTKTPTEHGLLRCSIAEYDVYLRARERLPQNYNRSQVTCPLIDWICQ